MEISRAIIESNETPAAYVLTNKERDYLYKGAARNLKERLKDHMAGRVSRTKNKRPLFLVYPEYCKTYSEALTREKYFKSGTGRAWLKYRIQSGQTVPPEADVPQAQNLLANAFDGSPPLADPSVAGNPSPTTILKTLIFLMFLRIFSFQALFGRSLAFAL